MGDWSEWIQDVGKQVITTATQAKYVSPVEIEKMKLQAYSQYGDPYTEGVANAPVRQWIPGISNAILILGGVALLAFALKD